MSTALNTLQNFPAVQQARALMGGMNPRQRSIIIGGALAVVLGIFVFVRVMSKPPSSVLYSALQPDDAQQVATALAELNIPYEMSADGASISVPANEIDRARLQMAARGLPHSGQLGFELFDKTNWSGSDFAEQVNYQRALEGELDRTIETIHGVQNARVHITMAHDSLFTADDRPAKAAVLLSLAGGGLDPAMVTAIQHLVASSVDHLAPQNVSIVDANGQMALDGSRGPQGQSKMEADLNAKIIATLAPIVGAQHVRASVSVAYDPTSSDDTQETYDPSKTAILTSQRSQAGGGSAPQSAGVPGTTSNLPAAQAAGTNFNAQLGLAANGGGQSSESQTYAVSRSVDHVIRPADTLQRISAAVVVDDAVQTVTEKGRAVTLHQARTAQELQQMQSLVAAAIGLDPARGDVLTVTNMPFLTPAAPSALAPPGARPGPLVWIEQQPPLRRYLMLGGAAVFILLLCGLLVWGVRGMFRGRPAEAAAHAALQQQHLSGAAAPETERVTDTSLDMLNMKELLAAAPEETPPEVRQVLQLKDRLAERVKREPAVASRLIQGWMNRTREEQQG